MLRKSVVFALFSFLFGSNIAAGAQQNWPMFQADPARSGRSTGKGPIGPEVVVVGSLTGDYLASPIVVGPEGNVYFVVGTGNFGTLYALAKDGRALWSSVSHDGAGFGIVRFGLAVGANGTVYFGAKTGQGGFGNPGVSAYSARGELLWNYDPAPSFYLNTGPHLAVGEEGNIYFNSSLNTFGSSDGRVIALNPNGVELLNVSGFVFQKTTGWTPLSVVPPFAYVTTHDSYQDRLRVSRVDLNSGGTPTIIRQTYGRNAGVTTDELGNVLLVSMTGLQKLTSNGDVVWQNTDASCSLCHFRPIVLPDGAVAISIKNEDGTAAVVCVNSDGTTRWTLPLSTTDTPVQLITDSNGTIYVPVHIQLGIGDSPRIYALNPTNGIIIWFYDFSTDTQVQDYIALSSDGNLFAALDRRDGFVDLYRFSDAFLSFPIPGMRPETAPITSVFDHAMDTRYCPLEFGGSSITTFLGEFGSVLDPNEPPVNANEECEGSPLSLYSYKKADSSAFLEGFNYVGTTTTGPTTVNYDGHPGWDYPVCIGTPVTAAAAGTIVVADDIDNDANGKRIWVDHGDGYVTVYQHLDRLDVSLGQAVTRGQRIGASGNTGGVGPHLHFEVRQEGVSVDPYGWRGGGEDPYALLGHISTPSLWLTYPYGEEPIFADGFECGNLNSWSVIE